MANDALPLEFGSNGSSRHQRKRRRRSRSQSSHGKSQIAKYCAQRLRLFHKYDEGIMLDQVSWYSVTPEKIAAHTAERFAAINAKVVVDAFCGAAGNSIQFAKQGAFTIAIELCRERIEIARNNCNVYGVEQSIEFIHGDAYQILPTLGKIPIDAVFLSPPWGGPSYIRADSFDVSVFGQIVEMARALTPNVAILVPRNIDHDNVLQTFGPCEIENNFLGGVLKTVTIYFGGLIQRPGS